LIEDEKIENKFEDIEIDEDQNNNNINKKRKIKKNKIGKEGNFIKLNMKHRRRFAPSNKFKKFKRKWRNK
jgi:hypothetical protein